MSRGRLITVEGLDGAGKTTLVAGLERALAAEGAGLGHLIKTTVWLADMRDYEGFNAARRAVMAELEELPASTCVGGAQFTSTDCRVEIEGVAVVPGA